MPEQRMDAFQRRIAAWNDTEASAPPLLGGGATKEVYDPAFDFGGGGGGGGEQHGGPVTVELWDADTIDAGLALIASGRCARPLLLVMADDFFPGGCVYTGSGAQEESLFRRTNLFRSLEMRHYPIGDDQALYAPGISVFKSGERAPEPFARVPEARVDFVACPGLRHPHVGESGLLSDADAARLRRKVELVFQVAHRHGHDALVLGALGCGAWKNPPDHVARIIRDVVSALSLPARCSVSTVVIAVLSGCAPGCLAIDDARTGCSNSEVFARHFKAASTPRSTM